MRDHRRSSLDVASLLQVGFQPDGLAETCEYVVTLLEMGHADRAAEALEHAAGLLADAEHADPAVAARVHLLAFRTALARGDSARAVSAVNELPGVADLLPADEIRIAKNAARDDDLLHPDVKTALLRVLETLSAGPAAVVSVVPWEDLPFDAQPDDAAEVDLAWLEPFEVFGAETELLGELQVADVAGETEPQGDLQVADACSATADRPSVEELTDVFVQRGRAAAFTDARRALDAAWTLILMENYAEAAKLFSDVVRSPDLRVMAIEGFVRCQLALGEPRAALDFLANARRLLYSSVEVPAAIRYWEGRAAELLMCSAYSGLSAEEFPDVADRLRGLVV